MGDGEPRPGRTSAHDRGPDELALDEPGPHGLHLDGPGGDAVCWLERVCDRCGGLSDGPPASRCDRCGASRR